MTQMPKCPKCGSGKIDRTSEYLTPIEIGCAGCGETFKVSLLADFAQFFPPAPSDEWTAVSAPHGYEVSFAKELGIVFCEDIAADGKGSTPWEVPAEPEPLYFETFREAVKGYIDMLARECDSLES